MPASTSLVIVTAALLVGAQAAVPPYKPASEALVVSSPDSIDESMRLMPRDSFKGVGCDGILLSQTQTDKAVTGLVNQCRGKTQNVFSYDGDIVAFYCQWHPGPQCSVGSANHAFDMITDQCGLYQASNLSSFSSSPLLVLLLCTTSLLGPSVFLPTSIYPCVRTYVH